MTKYVFNDTVIVRKISSIIVNPMIRFRRRSRITALLRRRYWPSARNI